MNNSSYIGYVIINKGYNMIRNLFKIITGLMTLTIGVAIVYGLIYLFNELLYQILVHPLRTLSVILGIFLLYGLIGIINKYTSKT